MKNVEWCGDLYYPVSLCNYSLSCYDTPLLLWTAVVTCFR